MQGPVVQIVTDDGHWNDVWAKFATGALTGQYVMRYFHSVLKPMMTDMRRHHGCRFPCGPTRGEIQTGLMGRPGSAFLNHGVSDDENNPKPNFLIAYESANTIGADGLTNKSGSDWIGPIFYDLAKDIPSSHVPAAQQPMFSAGAGYGGRRDADDDVQAFTGWIGVWLARLGVKVGVYGKITNGYKGNDGAPAGPYATPPGPFAPPGVVDCAICESDTVHYQSITHEYHSTPTAWNGVVGATTNPWNGNGQPTDTTTYNYKQVPTKVSWVSGTTVEVQFASNPHLKVGQTITLINMPDPTFNGTFVVTALPTTLKAQMSNPGANHVTLTTGFGSAGSAVYSLFETVRHAWDAIDFLETCQDSDPIYLYIAPRVVHIQPDNTYNKASSINYDGTLASGGTVDPNAAFEFGANWTGVDEAGVASPVGPFPTDSGFAAFQANWAARQQMMGDLDDMLNKLCTYLDGRWGLENCTIIITTDNGDQIGEQTIRTAGSGKSSAFEGSSRTYCYVASPHPAFPRGASLSNVVTMHADLPLTVLDVFGFLTGNQAFISHHAHTNRDGVSLVQLLDPSDTIHVTRVIPVVGDTGGGNSSGYTDGAGIKWLQGDQVGNFDTTETGDYEKTRVTRTAAQETQFQLRANGDGTPAHPGILNSRWQPANDVNPARSI